MTPHLLCLGGEDHDRRIAFMLALRDRGFRVTAAGSLDPAPFARAGLDYRRFRFERFLDPLADWRAVNTLFSLVSEVKPELVQSFDTKPNILAPLALPAVQGPQVVRTINGMGWVYSSRSAKAIALRPVYRALHRVAARRTTATVFQNRTDKVYFERRRMADPHTSRLIPGSGVDIEGFEGARAAGPAPNELRKRLGLVAAEIVITVSRLTREKGIPTLLEAAALIHRERPDVCFLLVGPRHSEGPLAVTQEEIDRHAPYVLALGPRSDVPSLLGLADAFAFPSEYREGVPRVLLEAALANLPIVATAIPGCNDVIRDGWSGFLVPPRTPRVLAARILDVLRDRSSARRMADRASELVRRDFGLESVVARYVALYTDLLEKRKSGRDEGLEVLARRA